MEKVLLTVEEAATGMAIGRTKMFELIATGAVESVRIGSSRRVPSAAVEAYVQRLRHGGKWARTKTAFST